MNKKKRFKYFVDKPFQTKFILNFIVLVLISAIISFGYIIYVDSQKFSKGILVEKLVKDIYKTSELYSEADSIKKNLKKLELKGVDINSIISEIDQYLSMLKRAEKDISLALSIRKELVKELSVDKGGILHYIDTAISEGKVNNPELLRNELPKIIYVFQSALQEAKFEGLDESFDKLLSFFKDEDSLKRLNAFKDKFLQYRSLVISSYSMLKEVPPFLAKIEDLKKAKLNSVVDESAIFGITVSALEIKQIISGIKSYNDVLYFETVTYDGKSYNLLELYWKPIVVLSLLQIVLITIFGLFFSHRIAGPVHRIKKELRQIANGELPVTHEIKLRKSDFLLDIAKEINNTLKSISERYNIK
ncbi:MAG: hypothetical protein ACP5PT_02825 [Brevinematia bacterium]